MELRLSLKALKQIAWFLIAFASVLAAMGLIGYGYFWVLWKMDRIDL